jgi:L-serine dehydratase
MESLRNLFRIGHGPSSSHTMGPARAAEQFRAQNPHAAAWRVHLFGSLAATGRGHLTDAVLMQVLAPQPIELLWHPETTLPHHPNGMRFEALDASGAVTTTWTAYSVGGGALEEDAQTTSHPAATYAVNSMAEILAWCETHGAPFWQLVQQAEGESFLDDHAPTVWRAMLAAMDRGLAAEGELPGGLHLTRRARTFWRRAQTTDLLSGRTARLSAYALAVAEENASGGLLVTAPTCGSAGVLPAVLRYTSERVAATEVEILRALATAGLIGNVVKTNASISGAEVGCQGEIGTACAMAAGAAAWLLGGTPAQVEYAAEMGMEHHLGLTCDPVLGLVQIPCIERNAFAALRAVESAEYALLSDGRHQVTFDDVVAVMQQTGRDLKNAYRETSSGGLAQRIRR